MNSDTISNLNNMPLINVLRMLYPDIRPTTTDKLFRYGEVYRNNFESGGLVDKFGNIIISEADNKYGALEVSSFKFKNNKERLVISIFTDTKRGKLNKVYEVQIDDAKRSHKLVEVYCTIRKFSAILGNCIVLYDEHQGHTLAARSTRTNGAIGYKKVNDIGYLKFVCINVKYIVGAHFLRIDNITRETIRKIDIYDINGNLLDSNLDINKDSEYIKDKLRVPINLIYDRSATRIDTSITNGKFNLKINGYTDMIYSRCHDEYFNTFNKSREE